MEIDVKGYTVLIDDIDYDLISKFKWRLRDTKYAMSFLRISKNKVKTIYMHRLITGAIDSNQVTDHINRNTLDNRRCNLRLTDYSGNARNKTASGKSKYLGVSISIKDGRCYIQSRIYVNGKTINLGSYKTEELAAMAYNTAAEKHFGEFANLNNV